MMTTSAAAHQTVVPSRVWQMPIEPETYPDRNPLLTDDEKALMEQYVSAPVRTLAGHRAKELLSKLKRFDARFLDVVRLTSHYKVAIANGRRHLFTHMLQTGRAFWVWPKEVWIEVIQNAPISQKAGGTRFWMILLAYLFCDFLYVGPSISYASMATAIFGKELLMAEVEKLRAPLVAVGYSQGPKAQDGDVFRWLCALCLLANRTPYTEALSAQTLITVDELLMEIPKRRVDVGRQLLLQLQTSLCSLNILDEPVLLNAASDQSKRFLTTWKNDATVHALWAAWICAFYEQTPYQHERSIRQTCYHLLTAGRWLKQYHPEITEPHQWTEALANEYVTYTSSALYSDQIPSSISKNARFQQSSQRLGPGGIDNRLLAMRSFFFHLQRRTYTVNGKYYPKLQVTWLPQEAFKTPNDIKAAHQPNPRDIQEDTWFKLIWAACTLSKEKLPTANSMQYPLAYYRAACLVWVTAARRSDEIRRLSVGCVSREWAPEMCDEQGKQIEPAAELCYLRIPTNKMRGGFYIPVPSYVADAIEVWESVRPPHQKMLEDRKTHKPTNYLFQYRNELMGRNFLNRQAIPLLCKLAGVSQTDVVGRITSHRARATTATWMQKMGMAPTDIGKLLGHTNPAKSLPWYLREDKHHLGRAYRKANPLERYVAAILDTHAHARQEPCVFYYLADGPDGRPRMCGNPHFSRCIHQMICRECEAFIDSELAEVIEKREGAIIISVPVPLPPQMVEELNEQDEAASDIATRLETLPPPALPSPAFHFNKKVPMRSPTTEAAEVHARLQQVEAQIAKKQGKRDQRSASLQALLKERAELQARLEAQEKGP